MAWFPAEVHLHCPQRVYMLCKPHETYRQAQQLTIGSILILILSRLPSFLIVLNSLNEQFSFPEYKFFMQFVTKCSLPTGDRDMQLFPIMNKSMLWDFYLIFKTFTTTTLVIILAMELHF